MKEKNPYLEGISSLSQGSIIKYFKTSLIDLARNERAFDCKHTLTTPLTDVLGFELAYGIQQCHRHYPHCNDSCSPLLM